MLLFAPGQAYVLAWLKGTHHTQAIAYSIKSLSHGQISTYANDLSETRLNLHQIPVCKVQKNISYGPELELMKETILQIKEVK